MKTRYVPAISILFLVLVLFAPVPLAGQEAEVRIAASASAAGASPVVEEELCCTVVSINHRQGRGVALDHRTGEEFPFHVTKRSVATRVKVGEALRMDRPNHRMTLYAPEECCQAVGAPDVEAAPDSAGIPFVDCCVVVSYQAGSGRGTARVRSTGATFEFHQTKSIFTGMKPGESLWIEPGTGKVGVARNLDCCAF